MLRIYLTNLGKYNEGMLVGEWVDLPVSEEELEKVFKRIGVIRQIKRCLFRQIKTGLSEHLTMG